MNKLSRSHPAYLLIFVNLIGLGLLYLFGKSSLSVLYIALSTLALFMIIYSLILFTKMGDRYLILIAAMLMTFGTLMLLRINVEYGAKQILWTLLSTFVYFGSYILYRIVKAWHKLWILYAALSAMLFTALLIFGETINGSRNWLIIGDFTIQPSEIYKLLVIFLLSCYFSGNIYMKIPQKLIPASIVYIFIGILVLQREWGTALLLFLVYFLMSYVFERDLRILAVNLCFVIIGAMLGFRYLHHIQARVAAWLNPWEDIASKGYQITQSMFAIAEGGYLGKGIGNGSPFYIPEVHSDFIFAAICEEMGILGGVSVILLFFILTYRMFKISIMTQSVFDKSVVLGIGLVFGIQTFIIIGGVIKFIPLTGITLPFISYGGSSMLISFASLGIVQAISAKNEKLRLTLK